MTYSAPVLFCLPGALSPSFLFGCVCVIVGFGGVLPFVQFLLPSLRREKSGAQFSLCVFSGVSKALVDVETLGKERVLPTKVTKAWRVSAPPGVPLLSSCVSLLPIWWWVLRPEFVFVCFVVFLGG